MVKKNIVKKKFKKHYMWNTRGKKYIAKTYKQHIKGVKLGHTHKKPKKTKRQKKHRTKRQKRHRTKRHRMRGGSWIKKPTTFKNPIELNKNVVDPPISTKNLNLNHIKVPGVKVGGKRLQKGGGNPMFIIPGWSDLTDVKNNVFNGVENLYHTVNGDKTVPSSDPTKGQYNRDSIADREKIADIGNMETNSELQVVEYKI